MRVLVTGSEGFLGRHFVEAYRSHGHEVYRVDVRSDVPTDARDVFRWFDGTPYDLVLHCAAVVNGRETIERSPMDQAVDFELDAGLFRWALKANVGRVVYFSSSAAYPIHLQTGLDDRCLEEDDIELTWPELPDALYGWTKLTGEILAHHARNAGLTVTIVRPFSGYGSDQDSCYPFPAIIDRVMRREDPLIVWGSGTQVRDFVHVDDIVSAVMTFVDHGVDGPINIGTGVPTSMIGLARLASELYGYHPTVNPLDTAPQGVQYRVADPTKMLKYYVPKVSISDGIVRALHVGC